MLPKRLLNKIATLIAADTALYKAEQDWKRINFYHQLPKKLRKPTAE
jgi:hypothetical protein